MSSNEDKLLALNKTQREAYDSVALGNNVFITGPGGTGKSFLMRTLFDVLPKKLGKTIALTALTGCAALLIHPKAKTLHSWAGVGLGKDPPAVLISTIRTKNRRAQSRWISTDILVIDEVSMLTKELFETLDIVGRAIRRNETQPFGGLQMVLVGDFFQLPPIMKSDISGASPPTVFVFESPLWKTLSLETFSLTEIVRQKDPIFQTILNEARYGTLSKNSIRTLAKRMNLDYSKEEIKPTMLFTRRAEVDDINMSHLKKLTTERKTFKVSTLIVPLSGNENMNTEDPFLKKAILKLDSNAPYSPDLTVAVGAQVMLLINMTEMGLVNGSRGVVTGYGPVEKKDDSTPIDPTLLVPIVKFKNGLEFPVAHDKWEVPDFPGVFRKQIPLRLAYAVTVHKCIAEDTLLSIPNKGLVEIKDLIPNTLSNNSILYPTHLSIQGIHTSKSIVEFYKGNIENGLCFETSYGYSITTSLKHPLLVFSKSLNTFIWKLAPDIQLNDIIVIKSNSQVSGDYIKINSISKKYTKSIKIPSILDEDIAYLIGCLIGDGSINKRSYRVDFISSILDKDIIINCKNILEDKFNIKLELREVNRSKHIMYRFFFHSKCFIDILESIGYNFGKSYTKEIPSSILNSPISVQKSVLQGLYDTDGGVSNNTINFTTTSPKMASQIQNLLLNIGIPSSKHILHNEVISSQKSQKTAYRLNISGHSAFKFVNTLGFKSVRKVECSQKRFDKSKHMHYKSQSFEIPNGVDIINSLRNEIRGNLKRFNFKSIDKNIGKYFSRIIHSKQKLRFDSLDYICNKIPNIQNFSSGKLLYFLYSSGIIFDTVSTIISKENIQFYDIGVDATNPCEYLPDGHDFIGNGFVNHNSQGSTLDCALIDVGSSTFEYGQAYVALSRVKDMNSLYIHDLEASAFRAHPKVKSFYKEENE